MTTYYYQCLTCGEITEPRVDYKKYGVWYKEIRRCSKCNSPYIEKKITIHCVKEKENNAKEEEE